MNTKALPSGDAEVAQLALAKALLAGTAREYIVNPTGERQWFRDIIREEIVALKPGGRMHCVSVGGGAVFPGVVTSVDADGTIHSIGDVRGDTGSATPAEALEWFKVPL